MDIREAADVPTMTANTHEEVQVLRATPEQATVKHRSSEKSLIVEAWSWVTWRPTAAMALG